MYVVPIIPALVQRRRARGQVPNQLEEIDKHVEEVPLVTQTQSEHGYVSPIMMMPHLERHIMI